MSCSQIGYWGTLHPVRVQMEKSWFVRKLYSFLTLCYSPSVRDKRLQHWLLCVGRKERSKESTSVKCIKVSKNTLDRDALNVVISLSSCLVPSKFWLKVVKINKKYISTFRHLLAPIDTIDVHNVQVLNSSRSTTHSCFAVHAHQLPRSLHLILPSLPCWSCEVCLSWSGKNTGATLQESKRRQGFNICLKNPNKTKEPYKQKKPKQNQKT